MTPRTLQDAVTAICTAFPLPELEAWAAQPEVEAHVHAHIGIGLWIRNQWVHGAGSPLADSIKRSVVLAHDDTVSSFITIALWKVLNGQPCPTVEELVSQYGW